MVIEIPIANKLKRNYGSRCIIDIIKTICKRTRLDNKHLSCNHLLLILLLLSNNKKYITYVTSSNTSRQVCNERKERHGKKAESRER